MFEVLYLVLYRVTVCIPGLKPNFSRRVLQ